MSRPIDYSYAPPAYPAPLTFPDGLFTKGRTRRKVSPADVLILTPDRNEKKADYTGAFLPEARNFAKLHGISRDQIHAINVSKPMAVRARQSLDLIREHRPRVLVVFCHGYSTGIQIGFRSPVNVKRKKGWYRPTKRSKLDFDELVALMATESPNSTIVLFCCSTGDDPDSDDETAPGSGDDSFADLLRDRLCEADARTCRVFAHVTAGHTTRNPHVKLYDGGYSATGGAGAAYIARPRSKSFRRLAKALKTDFRFRLPFMSISRINELLETV